ncbi:MAG TPA: isoprenylcysteine carboxylmethyltransferase family protein [Terriglobales bacterium]|jgi:protein-S-isoprenylcysteine O-methyltransferase
MELALKLITWLWIFILVVWAIGAIRTKRSVRRQSLVSRLTHTGMAAMAIMVGFSRRFNFGWLTRPLLPTGPGAIYAGASLTVAGIAFAVWARLILGRNWSGTVTVKQDHTLICRGPYTIVRHPIYTGLLLAGLGTALAYGQIRGLIAVALFLLLFILKIRIEERFMREQFGDDYRIYQERVKALIPFVA